MIETDSTNAIADQIAAYVTHEDRELHLRSSQPRARANQGRLAVPWQAPDATLVNGVRDQPDGVSALQLSANDPWRPILPIDKAGPAVVPFRRHELRRRCHGFTVASARS